jgi:hypothetical protein
MKKSATVRRLVRDESASALLFHNAVLESHKEGIDRGKLQRLAENVAGMGINGIADSLGPIITGSACTRKNISTVEGLKMIESTL